MIVLVGSLGSLVFCGLSVFLALRVYKDQPREK